MKIILRVLDADVREKLGVPEEITDEFLDPTIREMQNLETQTGFSWTDMEARLSADDALGYSLLMWVTLVSSGVDISWDDFSAFRVKSFKLDFPEGSSSPKEEALPESS